MFRKNIKDYLVRHKNYITLPVNGCSVYTNKRFLNSACVALKPTPFHTCTMILSRPGLCPAELNRNVWNQSDLDFVSMASYDLQANTAGDPLEVPQCKVGSMKTIKNNFQMET